jgi:hypothetical protein
MKMIVMLTVLSLVMPSAVYARDGARDAPLIETAPPGSAYDYVVHIRNTYAIGYNPEVKSDRHAMALKSVHGRCRSARIVDEQMRNPEIYGITSSFPDYLVMLRCS